MPTAIVWLITRGCLPLLSIIDFRRSTWHSQGHGVQVSIQRQVPAYGQIRTRGGAQDLSAQALQLMICQDAVKQVS